MNKPKERPNKPATHIVTIRDVLRSINHYETENLDQVCQGVETLFSVSERDASEAVDAAFALGYITETGALTNKGAAYQGLLDEAHTRQSNKEERVWPTNVLRIIRGVPGAGKTVLGQAIAKGLDNSVHLEIDNLLADKVAVSGKAMKQAALECHALTEIALLQGKNVVVSNIFARYKDLIPYFEIATYHSFRTQLIEAQGQWHSETRSDTVRASITSRWTDVILPARWKPWLRDRRLQLEMARKEKLRFASKTTEVATENLPDVANDESFALDA